MGPLRAQRIRIAGRRAPRGFTLLELLVVMVIAGMILGIVSFNAMPSERQTMQNEAQRIALLMQLARDEAIVRNRPIAFEADPERYRFLVREENEWQPITQDDLLREREFRSPPMALSIDLPLSVQGAQVRIVFGREPVDKPFLLTLSTGTVSVGVRADGIGHFVVE